MQSKIVIGMLVVILALINVSIFTKEQHLKQGDTIYLKLAPVDPRSLMQGDYMALRFEITEQLDEYFSLLNNKDAPKAHNGKIVVQLDQNNIGTFQSIYKGQSLQNNERLLNYRVRNNTIKLASNAFFFQEGNAEYYAQARYGEFKVNKQGELLLNALFTENLTVIKPEQ